MESDVNAILGSYAHGSTYDVGQWRNGALIKTAVTVMIWTTTGSGASIGDAHGRYNPDSAMEAGQWETGDEFCFNLGTQYY